MKRTSIKDSALFQKILSRRLNCDKSFLFSLCLLLSVFTDAIAQADSISDKKKSDELHEGYIKFIPLPAIGASPTTGLMIGVAPGAYWLMGDPKNTSLSNALGTIIYTSNKQWLITAKAFTYMKGNRWNMLTDIRYFITSQATYGLGTGPQSAKPVGTGFADYTDNPYRPIQTDQMMEFKYLRFHNTVNKRVRDEGVYVGIGYHFDYHYEINDKLLNLDTVPAVVTSHFAYQKSIAMSPTEYLTSGVSLNLMYDTRDNGVNPYKGRYFFFNTRMNSRLLGSNENSNLYWIESREYLHLSKSRPRHLIGFWNYGWLSTGKVPYLDLPAVGWDLFGRSGRAYTQGRFRGEKMIYNEIEYRVPLLRQKEWLGAVAFVNGTTASAHSSDIRLFHYYDIGGGIGLRVMINKKSRANLNIDYAFGKYGAQGFYFGLNEVF